MASFVMVMVRVTAENALATKIGLDQTVNAPNHLPLVPHRTARFAQIKATVNAAIVNVIKDT